MQHYIKTSDDPLLFRWWAQYNESHGNVSRALLIVSDSLCALNGFVFFQFDDAIKYYSMGKDTQSLVRILCHVGDEQKVVPDNAQMLPDSWV